MPMFKKTSAFADRGAVAERGVQKALEKWVNEAPQHREYSRLTDSKAARKTIKAAAADFEFYMQGFGVHFSGLIEVKETQHEYRLARDKVPQLARMRHRAQCGSTCIVVVLHSTTGVWRAINVKELATAGDKGSWNLTEVPGFASPREAMAAEVPGVFGG